MSTGVTLSDDQRVGWLFDDLVDTQMALLNMTERQVREGANARAHLAVAETQRACKALAQEERRFVDGLGQLVTSIPLDAFVGMQLVHGRDCWNDEAFMKSWLSKNEGARVKSTSGKTTIIAPGFAG